MTDQLWFVAGGLLLAAGIFITKYAVTAIAAQVVDQIGDALQERWQADIANAVTPLRVEIETVRSEVTTNGGGSLKDRVMSVERQLENLITRETG